MGIFNLSSLAMIAKPMFPEVWEAYQRLVDNGTIARIEATVQEMAHNGTLDRLIDLADNLERFTAVLERLEEKEKAVVKPRGKRAALPEPGHGNADDGRDNGAGVPGEPGPD